MSKWLSGLQNLLNNPWGIAIGSIVACFAAWFLGKQIVKWIQAYRNRRQSSEVEEARRKAQSANQRANEESDRLREIDGR